MLLLYFILLSSSFRPNYAAGEKCISVITPDYGLCTSGYGKIKNTSHGNDNDIYNNDICRRGFNVSFINLHPFSHRRFTTVITEVIQHCCGSSVNTTIVNNFNTMAQITPSSINTSHIIYPILSRAGATSLYGYHFVPLWDVPGAYYITTKRIKVGMLESLISSFGKLWPLFVVMLLLATAAGFIVWAIETWGNKEMFQRTFLVGLFDGFWWGFVSMTTVGYGDKIPKLLASRIFSVLWILIGITICSMFTASLTTEITNSVSPEAPKMEGKNVGVMKQSLYDVTLIAAHGGIVTEAEGINQTSDVLELISKLRNQEISGFVLDKFTYLQTVDYFDVLSEDDPDDHSFKDAVDYFMNRTLLTEVSLDTDKLVFGALLKELGDYIFFLDFIMDNRLNLQTCSTLHLNKLHQRIHGQLHDVEKEMIFSSDSGILSPTYVILGFIFCFGVVYEITRKKLRRVPHVKSVLHKLVTSDIREFSVEDDQEKRRQKLSFV